MDAAFLLRVSQPGEKNVTEKIFVRLRQSLRRNPGKAKSDIWSN
jgi:hypothetical protein